MPLPNSRVIPKGWSTHHAPVATGGMNATITFGEKTGEDRTGDDVVPTWSDVYNGPCRIQAMNEARTAEVAGQNVYGRIYLVQLDMETADEEIKPGMRGKVLTALNDAQLVGQDLWVVDPQMGSERFTRDVVCSDNQSDVPSQ